MNDGHSRIPFPLQACGTVTPFSGFDAEADCKKLRNAMKGAGELCNRVEIDIISFAH